jgi:hypothetical protein
MGVCLINRDAIFICGGMSNDFEARRECYSFNLTHTNWKKNADMSVPKLVSSGCLYSNKG